MRFKQHDDEFVLVPQHISKYGVYSARIRVFFIFHLLYERYLSLTCLAFFLYITTVLNWHKVYRKGVAKNLDVGAVVCTILKISFHDSLSWGLYRNVWIKSINLSCFAFFINEIVFNERIRNKESIMYCPVNTLSRERAYYTNVFVHILFLHFLPNLTVLYCVLMSKQG